MDYILGFTFDELQNETIEQLNQKQVEFTVKNLDVQIAGIQGFFQPGEEHRLYATFRDRLKWVFSEVCDEEYYATLRDIYSTQEKFSRMAKVLNRMGEVEPRITGLLASIIDDMNLAQGD
jgi:hypothetical protein